MKKMTYLMMLVLGLTAVNRTQAILSIKGRFHNAKEAYEDFKEAPKGEKIHSLVKSEEQAFKRNVVNAAEEVKLVASVA